MGTLIEDQERLRTASQDLFYDIAEAIGVVWLVARFGLTLKPWARERQIKNRWRTRSE